MNNLDNFNKIAGLNRARPFSFTNILGINNPFDIDTIEEYPTLEKKIFGTVDTTRFPNFVVPKLTKVSANTAANGFVYYGIYNYLNCYTNINSDDSCDDEMKVLLLTQLLILQSLYNTDIYGYYHAYNYMYNTMWNYIREYNRHNPRNQITENDFNIDNMQDSHADEMLNSIFEGNFIIPDAVMSSVPYMLGRRQNKNISEVYKDFDKILTEYANKNDYHLITRYRLSYDELVEKYGEKLIFKISKRAYYITGRGIWLSPYLSTSRYNEQLPSIGYFNLATFDKSLISSEFIEFAKANMKIFSKWSVESMSSNEIKNRFNSVIEKILLSDPAESVKQKMDYLCKELLEFIDSNNSQLSELKSNILNNIITKKTVNDFKLPNSNMKLVIDGDATLVARSLEEKRNEQFNLQTQITFSSSSQDNNIGQKAIQFIKAQYNANKAFIDKVVLSGYDNSQMIQIYNKFIPAIYTEHQSLENILKRASDEVINATKNSKYYNERYNALMGVVQDKNEIYIIPNVITILFQNKLCHYIKQDVSHARRYFDKNVADLLRSEGLFDWDHIGYCRNYHGNYGNSSDYGNVGCTGSFSTAFADAETSYNLNKEIALCLQYVRTLVPFDYAGNNSIMHCFICDKETKEIISASRCWDGFFEKHKCKIENGIITLCEEKNDAEKKNDDTKNEPAEADDDLIMDNIELDEIFDEAI